MQNVVFNIKIAQEVIEYAKKVSAERLTKGTWGNISVKSGEYVYITPSGYPYDKLKPKDICVVDMEGQKVFGNLKPSSELPLHIQIYLNRSNVGAIIHTHPIYSTIVSITQREIPPIVEDAVMILGETLKVSEYALPGTEELAQKALEALGTNNCVFLKNHGLVTVGENLQEAFIATLIAEKTAQIYVEALKVGNVSLLPMEHARLLREKYITSYRQK
ncbi:MAG: class II aldolase/adducin family protein [Fervidobacterium sp.]|uniref:L-fuculose-phosphate aldolase n=1 Tax=Fervidobacterium gondwanense DSM 13020 TaxID=1121883 RepID=A0A1M7SZU7_FERGO|nr:class II aldolase/adducin family protein [Fervidobacterium gondwanense]SHN63982.1 L-fuculose-phosphate aldolase [Fervidobacterium gondwanense DSM 13020]